MNVKPRAAVRTACLTRSIAQRLDDVFDFRKVFHQPRRRDRMTVICIYERKGIRKLDRRRNSKRIYIGTRADLPLEITLYKSGQIGIFRTVFQIFKKALKLTNAIQQAAENIL